MHKEVEIVKILIAGESWITLSTHLKGFDFFMNADFGGGADKIIDSLKESGNQVDYLPNHEAARKFPQTMDELSKYDVVMLSDIGANTLLLHPDTFNRSQRTPNRLKLLADWVRAGGGLVMVGGYLTFQGIYGAGCWHQTPVEDVLPVTLRPNDDRMEVPEGFNPVVAAQHPILEGLPAEWPFFLGYNKTVARDDSQVLMTVGDKGDPFLAVRELGHGRTAAFTSDCAPHWGSNEFYEWKHYSRFWIQLSEWLAKQR